MCSGYLSFSSHFVGFLDPHMWSLWWKVWVKLHSVKCMCLHIARKGKLIASTCWKISIKRRSQITHLFGLERHGSMKISQLSDTGTSLLHERSGFIKRDAKIELTSFKRRRKKLTFPTLRKQGPTLRSFCFLITLLNRSFFFPGIDHFILLS